MSFRIEYEVLEAGRTACRVAFGEQGVAMPASNRRDSLHELCEAVASIADGARTGRVVFEDELGEHHMNLERVEDDDVIVQVIWYDRIGASDAGPPSVGRLVIRGSTTIALLREQTYGAARHVLNVAFDTVTAAFLI